MKSPRPVVLSQSDTKSWQNCKRLYGWRRLQRLEPTARRSAPEIGVAVHAGLAAFHAGAAMEEAVGIMSEKLTTRAGPQSSFEDKSLGEAEGVASSLLPAYVEHWGEKNELWEPLNQEVEFLVEVIPGWWRQTFGGTGAAVELARTGVYLRGRADNLSILKGGALYIIDYKTAGRMDPRDLMKYELDFQLTAYIYGLSKQLTQDSIDRGGSPVKVEGAIIDLLVKTKIPQFAREDYTRSEDEMEEFELEFVEHGNQLREQKDRVEAGEDWKIVFPKSTEQCFRYGVCPFRDLCLVDTPIRRKAFDTFPGDYVDEASAELERVWREGEEGK